MLLTPRDEADVAEILSRDAAPVEVFAGASRRGIGGAVQAAAVLDVSALRGVVDYAPEEMIVTVRPGTPLGELRSLLAGQGQGLAFEPPGLVGLTGEDASQSVGGVIATNASGPRRLTAGAARDHFLGFRAVSGRGEPFRAGGRVVKNVTGFDLPKLLAGSWGTLAVLTEVTLRAVPLAEHEATLLLATAEAASAVDLMTQALASTHEVSCAAWDAAAGRVCLRLEGTVEGVRARVAALRELLQAPAEVVEDQGSRALWASIGAVEAFAAWPWLWRVVLPPAAAPSLLAGVAVDAVLLDWAGGLAWLGQGEAASDARELRALAASLGGRAMLVRAPAARPRGTRRFPPQESAVAALEARVKAAFDPDGRLNPGRLD